jgi:hypothetical protein
MEKVQLEVGEKITIKILSVGGELRISGRETKHFEAQAPEHGELKVDQDGDLISVSCRTGCLIFLPSQSRVEADRVGGDVRLTELVNDCMIRSIGGDLSLRRVGSATFELIGGDLHARRVRGDLMVDQIGGDAIVEKVQGNVILRAVGGDLVLRNVDGQVEASVGGDTSASLGAVPHVRSTLTTGGDLSCSLPDQASATVTLQAGGDITIPGIFEAEWDDEQKVIHLGEGEAEIDLVAGSDLLLRVGSEDQGYPDELFGDLLRDFDSKAVEIEARFGAMGAGLYGFDADRIGERVRRSIERAQRKAARASAHAKRKNKHKHAFKFRFGGMENQKIDATDEERLAILRMVEAGKISVEEAEKLLEALEGEV